jgi:uncharacterized protein YkwD
MIKRRHFLLSGAAALTATGCAPVRPALGPDGQPLPLIHRIDPGDRARIDRRVLARVNAHRRAVSVKPLDSDPALALAAARHARDMALRGRLDHRGSGDASPADRAARTGYAGIALGEAVSETYATDLETLADWMGEAETRAVLLDPAGRHMGLGFHQETSGKVWWVLMVGAGVVAES